MKFAYIDKPIEPLIGAKEAAEYLGFAPLTVRRMAHDGRLPSIAFPQRNGKFLHRFRVSDLEAYLTTLQRKPNQSDILPPPENLALRAG